MRIEVKNYDLSLPNTSSRYAYITHYKRRTRWRG